MENLEIHPIIEDILEEAEKIRKNQFPGSSFKDQFNFNLNCVLTIAGEEGYSGIDIKIKVTVWNWPKCGLGINLFAEDTQLLGTNELRLPNTEKIRNLIDQYEQVMRVQATLIHGNQHKLVFPKPLSLEEGYPIKWAEGLFKKMS